MSKYKRLFHIKKNQPVNINTKLMPMALRERVDKALKDMLEANIIERSVSQYCNLLWIVAKRMIVSGCV